MLKQFANVGSLLLATLLSSAHGSRQASSELAGTGITHRAFSISDPPVVFVATYGETHTVKSGETLWGIARLHGVSFEALAKLNGRDGDPAIRIGDELRLPKMRKSRPSQSVTPPAPQRPPASHQHRVNPGETLYRIAKRYGVSLEALKTANQISDPSTLRADQLLEIPRRGTVKIERQDPPKPTAPVVVETVVSQEEPPSPPPLETTTTTKPAPDRDEVQPSTSSVELAPYQVQEGDTVEEIARTYGLKPAELLRLNGKASNAAFQPSVGQQLMVPTDGSWYIPENKAASVQTATPSSTGSPLRRRPPRTKTMLVSHLIEPNDDLNALARRFNTTVDQIRLENPGIRSNRDLRVGADLKIRVKHSL